MACTGLGVPLPDEQLALRANRVLVPYSKWQPEILWPFVASEPLTVAAVCDTPLAASVVTVGAVADP